MEFQHVPAFFRNMVSEIFLEYADIPFPKDSESLLHIFHNDLDKNMTIFFKGT